MRGGRRLVSANHFNWFTLKSALRSVYASNIPPTDTKDGIVMEKKLVTGDSCSIPAVRARGIIKNMSPGALLSVISQTNVRHHWDERYIPGGLLERYDRRTHKSYSAQKGAGVFVSERDIVCVQTVVFPNGELEDGFEIVQTSVEGDEKNSGRVRAKITCAGWTVVPRGEYLELVYVMKSEFRPVL